MMPIEQQVCSYELAKRLAELGVRQESVFWWVDRKLTYTGGRASHAPRQGSIAAFTATELGEMLPWGIEGGNPPYTTLKILKLQNRGWIVLYKNKGGVLHQDGADTEADARAKMLIYLVENGMLSLEAPKGV
jgi:hypothetical protein